MQNDMQAKTRPITGRAKLQLNCKFIATLLQLVVIRLLGIYSAFL